MADTTASTPTLEEEVRQIGQEYLVPHDLSFSAMFNTATRVFLSRFDEALRRSYKDALALRRDGLVRELLQGRKLPVKRLRWHIEPEDPKDPQQKRVAEQVEKIIRAIPRFRKLRGDLLEAVFFGKAGVQLVWGYKWVDGRKRATITRHKPVNGDKIVHRFDGTPAVMVNSTFRPKDGTIIPTDRGMALLLDKPFYRDRFIIHEYEPTDTDFIYEGDMAEAIHGLGLRSWLWWLWFFRNETLGWSLDALQKIGANGQFVGYVPTGNPAAKDAMIQALIQLSRENVTVIEANPGGMGSPANSAIERYEPSAIAYDVMLQFIGYFDDQMRRVVLGQSLSANAQATGMGSKVAEFHEDTLTHILASDAEDLDETLDEQLVAPIVKYNWGRLPFQVRYKSMIDDSNVDKKIETATRLTSIGVQLDATDLREEAGFSPPKQAATSIGGSRADGPEGSGPGGEPATQGGGGGGRPALPAPQPSLQRNARDRSLDPGMMICWRVPDEVADRIALLGGEPASELHVTLAYLGKMSENPADAIAWAENALDMVAANPPLGGRIAGIGRFPASASSDGKDVIFADVDVKGLHELRTQLLGWLRLGDLKVRDDFMYHPHITLAYVDTTEKSPIDRLEPIAITIRELELWVGDQRIKRALVGQVGSNREVIGG